MTVEREPSRVGLGLTAGASIVAAVAALALGGGVGLLGVPIAVAGVYRTSRLVLGVGVLALFVGVLAASTTGVARGLEGIIALSMAGTLLTWDLGENAISVAEQLRARAKSDRIQLVHAAASGLVAAFFTTGAFIVFWLSAGGQPGIALVLLVFGALVAVLTLKE